MRSSRPISSRRSVSSRRRLSRSPDLPLDLEGQGRAVERRHAVARLRGARRPCDRTSTCVSPARFSRQVSIVGTDPARLRLSRTCGARSSPMPTIKQVLLGLVLAAGVLAPARVFADRAPTPEERSSIETVLRNEGFLRWGRIELDDDDVWEVDDAY